jgi:uncharacterized protein
MVTNILIGREKERCILTRLYESSKSEFLALYGRRRVGKTFLISNFFSKVDCTFFYITGIKNAAYKKQIGQFAKIIGDVFYSGTELKPPKNWLELRVTS